MNNNNALIEDRVPRDCGCHMAPFQPVGVSEQEALGKVVRCMCTLPNMAEQLRDE